MSNDASPTTKFGGDEPPVIADDEKVEAGGPNTIADVSNEESSSSSSESSDSDSSANSVAELETHEIKQKTQEIIRTFGSGANNDFDGSVARLLSLSKTLSRRSLAVDDNYSSSSDEHNAYENEALGELAAEHTRRSVSLDPNSMKIDWGEVKESSRVDEMRPLGEDKISEDNESSSPDGPNATDEASDDEVAVPKDDAPSSDGPPADEELKAVEEEDVAESGEKKPKAELETGNEPSVDEEETKADPSAESADRPPLEEETTATEDGVDLDGDKTEAETGNELPVSNNEEVSAADDVVVDEEKAAVGEVEGDKVRPTGAFVSITMAGINNEAEQPPISDEHDLDSVTSSDDDDDLLIDAQDEAIHNVDDFQSAEVHQRVVEDDVVAEANSNYSPLDVSRVTDASLGQNHADAVILDSNDDSDDDIEGQIRRREIEQMGHVELTDREPAVIEEVQKGENTPAFMTRHPCLLFIVAGVIVLGLIIFGIVSSRA